MDPKVKVTSLPHICGVELDFDGELAPSYKDEFLKFYNSYENNNNFSEVYFGQKTVRFTEASSNTRSGTVYKPKLKIKFPSNDLNRALRIEFFKNVKFIKILLSNGTNMVLGRNDYFQNARPKVNINSNLQQTEVSFSTRSMIPAGFLPSSSGAIGFPVDIPIDFINYT